MKKLFFILFLFSSGLSFGQGIHSQNQINKQRLTTDSLYLPPSLTTSNGFNGAAAMFFTGNSITFGLNATVVDSNYAYRLARSFSLPAIDSGVSSTFASQISFMHVKNITYPNTYVSSMMGGFNDMRARNILTAIDTRNTIVQDFKTVWVNQFLGTIQPATGGTGVTRSGTWNTGYNCRVNAAGKSTSGAYTSTTSSYIEYAFTDSTVVAWMETQSVPVTSTVEVKIDGSIVTASYSLGGQNDGLGPQAFNPVCLIYTGLSFGAHTLRVTVTGTSLVIMDCFGSLVPANSVNSKALLFFEVPKMDATGYATGGAQSSDARIDSMNVRIDSLAAALPPAWPLYVVKTNNFYIATTSSGLSSSDHIHPNNLGHLQISRAGIAATSGTNMSDGALISQKFGDGTTDGYYGSTNGVKKRLAFQSDIGLQTALTNNPNVTASNFINGNTFQLTLSNFASVLIDSTYFTASGSNTHGILEASGPSSTIRLDSRNDAGNFQFYLQSGRIKLFDGYNGRDAGFVYDTSYRVLFRNSVANNVLLTPTATVHIGGNTNGVAGHASLKIDKGALMLTPEQFAAENDANFLYFTDSALNRRSFTPFIGQTTLISGTKAITIPGLTTTSKGFFQPVSQGGTTSTTQYYIVVCTANTATISAVTSAGTNTVNTLDTTLGNLEVYP